MHFVDVARFGWTRFGSTHFGSTRLGSAQDRRRDIPPSCAPEIDTRSTKSCEHDVTCIPKLCLMNYTNHATKNLHVMKIK
ncbi:hypothetical protein Hanom_Chr13g01185751 [Helianthus anomalus]